MSNTKSGLLGLPVETLNEIGGYLERASDIMHLSHTCQFLRQVTVHPHAPCWRTFFDDHYDLPPGKAVSALRDRAIERDVLPYTVTYKCGTGEITRGRITPNEEIALKIIRDVIVESCSSPIGKNPFSKNVIYLQDFARLTNICDVSNYWNRRLGHPTRLIQAVHLMLLVPQLQQAEQKKNRSTPGDLFPISQKSVYAHPDRVAGLFAEDEYMSVNLDLLGHLSNFFKYHATCREEPQMSSIYKFLGDHEKPRMWDHQLMQGPQKLGRHWKGVMSFLHGDEVDLLRTYKDPTMVFAEDKLLLSEGLIDLDFDFGPPKMIDGTWARSWDEELRSTPSVRLIEALKKFPRDWIESQKDPRKFVNDVATEYLRETGDCDDYKEYMWRRLAETEISTNTPEEWQELEEFFSKAPASMTTRDRPYVKKRPSPLQNARAGEDYHHFTGKGLDVGEEFKVRGNLHAVGPVEGIPGWQRITFMKWFTGSGVDPTLYACEGVVLPGNKIILGRWWAPGDDDEKRNVGPFIFWNV